MNPVPQPTNSKNTIIVVIAVFVVLFACGALVCLGAIGGGLVAANSDKIYYPECEKAGADQCERCCLDKGHYGYSHADGLGVPGKPCACL